jgi:hypothetical protein
MSSERQKQGIDGEGPSAKDLKKAGVDAGVDLDAHLEGNVDPTGHVSSGVQTGPLRGADEAPVASTEEAMRQERPGASPGDKVEKSEAPSYLAVSGKDVKLGEHAIRDDE